MSERGRIALLEPAGSALCVRLCLAVVVADLLRPLAPFIEGAGALIRDAGASVAVFEAVDATESGRFKLDGGLMPARG
jgi:hypothetical protein